jgi:hypothetical protein
MERFAKQIGTDFVTLEFSNMQGTGTDFKHVFTSKKKKTNKQTNKISSLIRILVNVCVLEIYTSIEMPLTYVTLQADMATLLYNTEFHTSFFLRFETNGKHLVQTKR